MTSTHTTDRTYDLISVAYHALQGVETYEQYVRDAESRDDQEVAQFFRDVQSKYTEVADGAKRLLQARLDE